jgi:hypothetical protein
MIRTETYHLVGTYHWLTGAGRKAVRWWERSLAEGERLGARPELARTHAEIARRASGAAGKLRKVGGKSAAEHLEAARSLFAELSLDRELAQLEGPGHLRPGVERREVA